MYSCNEPKLSLPYIKLGDGTLGKEIKNLGRPNEFVSY